MRRKLFKFCKRYSDVIFIVFSVVAITGMFLNTASSNRRADATDRVVVILKERLEIDRAIFEMMKGVQRAEGK